MLPPVRASRSAGTRRLARITGVALAVALPAVSLPVAAHAQYVQTNLVSDVPGLALTLDPQLKNPWGIALSGGSPFWVSNGGTGTATLYNGAGVKQALVVSIPGPLPAVPGVPTGQVFNNAASFALPVGGNATFLFASATGTISGWNGAAGTTALTVVNRFPSASYTGLAIGGSGASARLYAANFGTGQVDVFDGGFNSVSGGFVDPSLPSGFLPFNVQNVAGTLYVTYARKDPITGRSIPGGGVVDAFDAAGSFLRRVSSGGPLDAPWGIALAPSGFGPFGGSLLVGNFGDGTINAFDPLTGLFRGTLTDANGQALVNSGLWGITFGNGGNGGSTNTLYFAAGINDEQNGLFGSIAVVPEPSTLALLATGLGAVLMGGVRRTRRRERAEG